MRNMTNHSISELLADYRQKGHLIARASLVVGSLRDPATIGNPHIRAHSLEGKLFRSTLEQALEKQIVGTVIFQERDAYDKATTLLKKSSVDVRRAIQNFGRHTEGPWRADQKLAMLAAWVALAMSSPWQEGSGDGNIRCD